jgi:hypothetical protein
MTEIKSVSCMLHKNVIFETKPIIIACCANIDYSVSDNRQNGPRIIKS